MKKKTFPFTAQPSEQPSGQHFTSTTLPSTLVKSNSSPSLLSCHTLTTLHRNLVLADDILSRALNRAHQPLTSNPSPKGDHASQTNLNSIASPTPLWQTSIEEFRQGHFASNHSPSSPPTSSLNSSLSVLPIPSDLDPHTFANSVQASALVCSPSKDAPCIATNASISTTMELKKDNVIPSNTTATPPVSLKKMRMENPVPISNLEKKNSSYSCPLSTTQVKKSSPSEQKLTLLKSKSYIPFYPNDHASPSILATSPPNLIGTPSKEVSDMDLLKQMSSTLSRPSSPRKNEATALPISEWDTQSIPLNPPQETYHLNQPSSLTKSSEIPTFDPQPSSSVQEKKENEFSEEEMKIEKHLDTLQALHDRIVKMNMAFIEQHNGMLSHSSAIVKQQTEQQMKLFQEMLDHQTTWQIAQAQKLNQTKHSLAELTHPTYSHGEIDLKSYNPSSQSSFVAHPLSTTFMHPNSLHQNTLGTNLSRNNNNDLVSGTEQQLERPSMPQTILNANQENTSFPNTYTYTNTSPPMQVNPSKTKKALSSNLSTSQTQSASNHSSANLSPATELSPEISSEILELRAKLQDIANTFSTAPSQAHSLFKDVSIKRVQEALGGQFDYSSAHQLISKLHHALTLSNSYSSLPFTPFVPQILSQLRQQQQQIKPFQAMDPLSSSDMKFSHTFSPKKKHVRSPIKRSKLVFPPSNLRPPPSSLIPHPNSTSTNPLARPTSPLRPPNPFYQVRLSQNPIFLRRTSIKPPSIPSLPPSKPPPFPSSSPPKKNGVSSIPRVSTSIPKSQPFTNPLTPKSSTSVQTERAQSSVSLSRPSGIPVHISRLLPKKEKKKFYSQGTIEKGVFVQASSSSVQTDDPAFILTNESKMKLKMSGSPKLIQTDSSMIRQSSSQSQTEVQLFLQMSQPQQIQADSTSTHFLKMEPTLTVQTAQIPCTESAKPIMKSTMQSQRTQTETEKQSHIRSPAIHIRSKRKTFPLQKKSNRKQEASNNVPSKVSSDLDPFTSYTKPRSPDTTSTLVQTNVPVLISSPVQTHMTKELTSGSSVQTEPTPSVTSGVQTSVNSNSIPIHTSVQVDPPLHRSLSTQVHLPNNSISSYMQTMEKPLFTSETQTEPKKTFLMTSNSVQTLSTKSTSLLTQTESITSQILSSFMQTDLTKQFLTLSQTDALALHSSKIQTETPNLSMVPTSVQTDCLTSPPTSQNVVQTDRPQFSSSLVQAIPFKAEEIHSLTQTEFQNHTMSSAQTDLLTSVPLLSHSTQTNVSRLVSQSTQVNPPRLPLSSILTQTDPSSSTSTSTFIQTLNPVPPVAARYSSSLIQTENASMSSSFSQTSNLLNPYQAPELLPKPHFPSASSSFTNLKSFLSSSIQTEPKIALVLDSTHVQTESVQQSASSSIQTEPMPFLVLDSTYVQTESKQLGSSFMQTEDRVPLNLNSTQIQTEPSKVGSTHSSIQTENKPPLILDSTQAQTESIQKVFSSSMQTEDRLPMNLDSTHVQTESIQQTSSLSMQTKDRFPLKLDSTHVQTDSIQQTCSSMQTKDELPTSLDSVHAQIDPYQLGFITSSSSEQIPPPPAPQYISRKSQTINSIAKESTAIVQTVEENVSSISYPVFNHASALFPHVISSLSQTDTPSISSSITQTDSNEELRSKNLKIASQAIASGVQTNPTSIASLMIQTNVPSVSSTLCQTHGLPSSESFVQTEEYEKVDSNPKSSYKSDTITFSTQTEKLQQSSIGAQTKKVKHGSFKVQTDNLEICSFSPVCIPSSQESPMIVEQKHFEATQTLLSPAVLKEGVVPPKFLITQTENQPSSQVLAQPENSFITTSLPTVLQNSTHKSVSSNTPFKSFAAFSMQTNEVKHGSQVTQTEHGLVHVSNNTQTDVIQSSSSGTQVTDILDQRLEQKSIPSSTLATQTNVLQTTSSNVQTESISIPHSSSLTQTQIPVRNSSIQTNSIPAITPLEESNRMSTLGVQATPVEVRSSSMQSEASPHQTSETQTLPSSNTAAFTQTPSEPSSGFVRSLTIKADPSPSIPRFVQIQKQQLQSVENQTNTLTNTDSSVQTVPKVGKDFSLQTKKAKSHSLGVQSKTKIKSSISQTRFSHPQPFSTQTEYQASSSESTQTEKGLVSSLSDSTSIQTEPQAQLGATVQTTSIGYTTSSSQASSNFSSAAVQANPTKKTTSMTQTDKPILSSSSFLAQTILPKENSIQTQTQFEKDAACATEIELLSYAASHTQTSLPSTRTSSSLVQTLVPDKNSTLVQANFTKDVFISTEMEALSHSAAATQTHFSAPKISSCPVQTIFPEKTSTESQTNIFKNASSITEIKPAQRTMAVTQTDIRSQNSFTTETEKLVATTEFCFQTDPQVSSVFGTQTELSKDALTSTTSKSLQQTSFVQTDRSAVQSTFMQTNLDLTSSSTSQTQTEFATTNSFALQTELFKTISSSTEPILTKNLSSSSQSETPLSSSNSCQTDNVLSTSSNIQTDVVLTPNCMTQTEFKSPWSISTQTTQPTKNSGSIMMQTDTVEHSSVLSQTVLQSLPFVVTVQTEALKKLPTSTQTDPTLLTQSGSISILEKTEGQSLSISALTIAPFTQSHEFKSLSSFSNSQTKSSSAPPSPSVSLENNLPIFVSASRIEDISSTSKSGKTERLSQLSKNPPSEFKFLPSLTLPNTINNKDFAVQTNDLNLTSSSTQYDVVSFSSNMVQTIIPDPIPSTQLLPSVATHQPSCFHVSDSPVTEKPFVCQPSRMTQTPSFETSSSLIQTERISQAVAGIQTSTSTTSDLNLKKNSEADDHQYVSTQTDAINIQSSITQTDTPQLISSPSETQVELIQRPSFSSNTKPTNIPFSYLPATPTDINFGSDNKMAIDLRLTPILPPVISVLSSLQPDLRSTSNPQLTQLSKVSPASVRIASSSPSPALTASQVLPLSTLPFVQEEKKSLTSTLSQTKQKQVFDSNNQTESNSYSSRIMQTDSLPQSSEFIQTEYANYPASMVQTDSQSAQSSLTQTENLFLQPQSSVMAQTISVPQESSCMQTENPKVGLASVQTSTSQPQRFGITQTDSSISNLSASIQTDPAFTSSRLIQAEFCSPTLNHSIQTDPFSSSSIITQTTTFTEPRHFATQTKTASHASLMTQTSGVLQSSYEIQTDPLQISSSSIQTMPPSQSSSITQTEPLTNVPTVSSMVQFENLGVTSSSIQTQPNVLPELKTSSSQFDPIPLSNSNFQTDPIPHISSFTQVVLPSQVSFGLQTEAFTQPDVTQSNSQNQVQPMLSTGFPQTEYLMMSNSTSTDKVYPLMRSMDTQAQDIVKAPPELVSTETQVAMAAVDEGVVQWVREQMFTRSLTTSFIHSFVYDIVTQLALGVMDSEKALRLHSMSVQTNFPPLPSTFSFSSSSSQTMTKVYSDFTQNTNVAYTKEQGLQVNTYSTPMVHSIQVQVEPSPPLTMNTSPTIVSCPLLSSSTQTESVGLPKDTSSQQTDHQLDPTEVQKADCLDIHTGIQASVQVESREQALQTSFSPVMVDLAIQVSPISHHEVSPPPSFPTVTTTTTTITTQDSSLLHSDCFPTELEHRDVSDPEPMHSLPSTVLDHSSQDHVHPSSVHTTMDPVAASTVLRPSFTEFSIPDWDTSSLDLPPTEKEETQEVEHHESLVFEDLSRTSITSSVPSTVSFSEGELLSFSTSLRKKIILSHLSSKPHLATRSESPGEISLGSFQFSNNTTLSLLS